MKLNYRDREMTDAERLASLETVLAVVICRVGPINFSPTAYVRELLDETKPKIELDASGGFFTVSV